MASAAPTTATAATAEAPNRAAVIVDTGTEVHEVVITFTEDSITGVEALQLAGADPQTFPTDPGVAVCSLYGVGRPADPDCLQGQDRDDAGDNDNGYWAYFQAPSGTTAFAAATVDPATSEIRDGDVEGWKWGDGTTAPVYVSVADLTAAPGSGATPDPPTTTPPISRPPTTCPQTIHPPTSAPPVVAPAVQPTVRGVVSKAKPAVIRVVPTKARSCR